MTMQTAADFDRIRDRDDNVALERMYGAPVLTKHEIADQKERAWQLREEEKKSQRIERLDSALAEVMDVQRCQSGGTLDYTAAAGVLIEYLPEILDSLRAELGRAA